MKRTQKPLKKNTSTLTKIIIFLSAIIICLISYIVTAHFIHIPRTPTTASPTYMSETKKATTKSEISDISSTRTSSFDATTSSSKIPSYEVEFPRGTVLFGETNNQKFAITTYTTTDEIVIAYSPKGNYSADAHMGEVANFITTTVSTTNIQVTEEGVTKNVNVNTELKIPENTVNTPSIDFFTPFNGNDTKIYAYQNDDGKIVLAFTSNGDHEPFIAIPFTEKSNE